MLSLPAPLHWLHPVPALNVALILAIAASPVLYSAAWCRPRAFAAWARPREPEVAMGLLSDGIKVVQFALLAAVTDWGVAARAPAAAWATFGVLVGVGQLLNLAVYYRLGRRGVYYGVRFGRRIPWVTSFPYSHLRHPQFTGTSLCVVGLAATTALPLAPLLFWLVTYVYCALLESVEVGDERTV